MEITKEVEAGMKTQAETTSWPKHWVIKKDLGQYFNYFKDIPEEKWCVGTYGYDANGPHCALGHLCRTENAVWPDPSNHPLNLLFKKELRLKETGLITVNDSLAACSTYHDLGDSPKERVLNAIILIESGILEDM